MDSRIGTEAPCVGFRGEFIPTPVFDDRSLPVFSNTGKGLPIRAMDRIRTKPPPGEP